MKPLATLIVFLGIARSLSAAEPNNDRFAALSNQYQYPVAIAVGIKLEQSQILPTGYKLVWQDEFDCDKLDTNKWSVRVGPRRENHIVAEAVSVKEGVLTITTFTENGKHNTGYLWTKSKYEACYGYYEARIRFNSTSGEWGAFWLNSPTMGKMIGDPAKAGVEIDIVEHRVRDGKGVDIANSYPMTVHWDGYAKGVHKQISSMSHTAPLQGEWHTYGLLWTPDRYRFYLDGVEQWTTTKAVSQRSEYILLCCEIVTHEIENIAWAGKIPEGGYGSRDASKTKMEVDYVRVYQQP